MRIYKARSLWAVLLVALLVQAGGASASSRRPELSQSLSKRSTSDKPTMSASFSGVKSFASTSNRRKSRTTPPLVKTKSQSPLKLKQQSIPTPNSFAQLMRDKYRNSCDLLFDAANQITLFDPQRIQHYLETSKWFEDARKLLNSHGNDAGKVLPILVNRIGGAYAFGKHVSDHPTKVVTDQLFDSFSNERDEDDGGLGGESHASNVSDVDEHDKWAKYSIDYATFVYFLYYHWSTVSNRNDTVIATKASVMLMLLVRDCAVILDFMKAHGLTQDRDLVLNLHLVSALSFRDVYRQLQDCGFCLCLELDDQDVTGSAADKLLVLRLLGALLDIQLTRHEVSPILSIPYQAPDLRLFQYLEGLSQHQVPIVRQALHKALKDELASLRGVINHTDHEADQLYKALNGSFECAPFHALPHYNADEGVLSHYGQWVKTTVSVDKQSTFVLATMPDHALATLWTPEYIYVADRSGAWSRGAGIVRYKLKPWHGIKRRQIVAVCHSLSFSDFEKAVQEVSSSSEPPVKVAVSALQRTGNCFLEAFIWGLRLALSFHPRFIRHQQTIRRNVMQALRKDYFQQANLLGQTSADPAYRTTFERLMTEYLMGSTALVPEWRSALLSSFPYTANLASSKELNGYGKHEWTSETLFHSHYLRHVLDLRVQFLLPFTEPVNYTDFDEDSPLLPDPAVPQPATIKVSRDKVNRQLSPEVGVVWQKDLKERRSLEEARPMPVQKENMGVNPKSSRSSLEEQRSSPRSSLEERRPRSSMARDIPRGRPRAMSRSGAMQAHSRSPSDQPFLGCKNGSPSVLTESSSSSSPPTVISRTGTSKDKSPRVPSSPRMLGNSSSYAKTTTLPPTVRKVIEQKSRKRAAQVPQAWQLLSFMRQSSRILTDSIQTTNVGEGARRDFIGALEHSLQHPDEETFWDKLHSLLSPADLQYLLILAEAMAGKLDLTDDFLQGLQRKLPVGPSLSSFDYEEVGSRGRLLEATFLDLLLLVASSAKNGLVMRSDSLGTWWRLQYGPQSTWRSGLVNARLSQACGERYSRAMARFPRIHWTEGAKKSDDWLMWLAWLNSLSLRCSRSVLDDGISQLFSVQPLDGKDPLYVSEVEPLLAIIFPSCAVTTSPTTMPVAFFPLWMRLKRERAMSRHWTIGPVVHVARPDSLSASPLITKTTTTLDAAIDTISAKKIDAHSDSDD
jgi:hypothetical protein